MRKQNIKADEWGANEYPNWVSFIFPVLWNQRGKNRIILATLCVISQLTFLESLLLQLLPLSQMNPRFRKTQPFQEFRQIPICLPRIHSKQMFNNLSIATGLRHHHFQTLHKVFIIITCCTKQLVQGRSYAFRNILLAQYENIHLSIKTVCLRHLNFIF